MAPTPPGTRPAARAAVFAVLGLGLVVLALSLVLHTLRATSRQPDRQPKVAGLLDLAATEVRLGAEHLSQALALPTISSADPALLDPRPSLLLHGWLARTHPYAHIAMRRETFGGLSLLYTCEGTQPQLAPVLILSHLDVAPGLSPPAALIGVAEKGYLSLELSVSGSGGIPRCRLSTRPRASSRVRSPVSKPSPHRRGSKDPQGLYSTG